MDRVQSSRVEQRPCSIRVRSIRVQNGRCSVRFNRVRVEPDLCSVRVWLNRVSNGKFEFETRLGSTRFDSIAISGCVCLPWHLLALLNLTSGPIYDVSLALTSAVRRYQISLQKKNENLWLLQDTRQYDTLLERATEGVFIGSHK